MRSYRDISEEHVQATIGDLIRDGYSQKNASTRWDVISTSGEALPPKLVLKGAAAKAGVTGSVANKGGGWPTNDILEYLGCTIVPKGNGFDDARPPSELSDEELRELAVAKGKKVPGTATVERVVRERHWAVAEYAKRKAKGRCDLCRETGPFSIDGVPFLECHHVLPLAENGSDMIENAVALCPNCHRKMHMVSAAGDKETLRQRISLRG